MSTQQTPGEGQGVAYARSRQTSLRNQHVPLTTLGDLILSPETLRDIRSWGAGPTPLQAAEAMALLGGLAPNDVKAAMERGEKGG